MLKEQLFGLAIKALSEAHENKERIKNLVKSKALSEHVRTIKDTARSLVKTGLEILEGSAHERDEVQPKKNTGRSVRKKTKEAPASSIKKERKSSIKPICEIDSKRADIILKMIKTNQSTVVKKTDAIEGKKSLAYLVWALGHAENAHLSEGISVHDVSALLYRASNIELYPINISRVVYGNKTLIRQVGRQKRTKTYLLSDEGKERFKKFFA